MSRYRYKEHDEKRHFGSECYRSQYMPGISKETSNAERDDEAALDMFEVVFESYGKMELKKALSRLRSRNEARIQYRGPERFIQSYGNILKLKRYSKSNRETVDVLTRMPLKFCPEFEKNGCLSPKSCKKLHICPYYVKGNCAFNKNCRMSHDIKDTHTKSLLKPLGLVDIASNLWLQVLKNILSDTRMERAASSHEVPEICKFYNNQGGCREDDKCAFLHVCQHFIEGKCKFGDSCMRSHELKRSRHHQTVLGHFSLHKEKDYDLLAILRDRKRKTGDATSSSDLLLSSYSSAPKKAKPASQSATNTGNPTTSLICGFHLRGQCNYGNKCMHHHTELPYRWELLDGPDWKRLSEDLNMMLEREYSDPSKNEFVFYDQGQSYKIDFDKLTAIAESKACPLLCVRRLSTVSSVNAPPGHVFSTWWLWYWQDENDNWQNYDCPSTGISPNTTSSSSLENDFEQGKAMHSFSAGNSNYSLSFIKMTQTNLKSQTARNVRRRPEFVAKVNMKEIAKRRKKTLKDSASSQSLTSSCSNEIPSHWQPMDDKTSYVLIDLPLASPEYQSVNRVFMKTMNSARVKKIERVQNPDLWAAFVQKKWRMTKKANDVPPQEMPQLFHGTDSDIVNAVCQQGFDWRMCGKHGTVYGKGSYFARDASYSDRYTTLSHGDRRKMFVARLLVGSCALGTASMTRPPPKNPSNPHGDLHDSCVDNNLHPSIYVVFDNSQCYPEYLITY